MVAVVMKILKIPFTSDDSGVVWFPKHDLDPAIPCKINLSRASIAGNILCDNSIALSLVTIDGSNVIIAEFDNKCIFMDINLSLDDSNFGLKLTSGSSQDSDCSHISVNILCTITYVNQPEAVQEFVCSSCTKVDDILVAFHNIRDKFTSAVMDMRKNRLYGCTTLLIGDSILRYVEPAQLKPEVYVQSLGGCKIEELENIISCLSLTQLKNIVIHVGVNNTHGMECHVSKESEKYRVLLHTCTVSAPNAKIFISGICPRGDKIYSQQFVFRLNKELSQLSEEFTGSVFMDNYSVCHDDNGDIDSTNMANDRLHLSPKGTKLLLKNIDSRVKIVGVELKIPESNSWKGFDKPNWKNPANEKSFSSNSKQKNNQNESWSNKKMTKTEHNYSDSIPKTSIPTSNSFSDLNIGGLFDDSQSDVSEEHLETTHSQTPANSLTSVLQSLKPTQQVPAEQKLEYKNSKPEENGSSSKKRKISSDSDLSENGKKLTKDCAKSFLDSDSSTTDVSSKVQLSVPPLGESNDGTKKKQKISAESFEDANSEILVNDIQVKEVGEQENSTTEIPAPVSVKKSGKKKKSVGKKS